MTEPLNFDMGGEKPEVFQAADTNPQKWSPEDHTDNQTAKSFLGDLRATYNADELANLNNMLSTVIDDEGHGLGDSRLFIRAAAKAARKFDEVVRKREGGEREDGQKQIKYHMPLDPGQRRGLVAEAKRLLDLELMAARNEYIRRSGRSLPGWWR
jgi:hypothetical protein